MSTQYESLHSALLTPSVPRLSQPSRRVAAPARRVLRVGPSLDTEAAEAVEPVGAAEPMETERTKVRTKPTRAPPRVSWSPNRLVCWAAVGQVRV
jgi:hypothetical protein